MEDLTFGEQVKIILGRKGMTIKELAEQIEEQTGKKMSRQNLTQRLGRDNFQEQDMRMIAGILGCSFQLSILAKETAQHPQEETAKKETAVQDNTEPLAILPAEESTADREERDMTIGELYEIHQELDELEKEAKAGEPAETLREELENTGKKEKFPTGGIFFRKKEKASLEKERQHADQNHRNAADREEKVSVGKTYEKAEDFEPVLRHNDEAEDRELGEVNPYTGREYQSNSVRMHPTRIGYVQVYDRKTHKWTDMTEWAFLGYQERMKALLGKSYEPPIYLD
ncbi:hypothetical protein OCV51_00735 [Faecalicatena acetigenes]|uniref:HTH cro/C1-type domain-containing protein n=1 Tax=Faecalicatena acetigenes TaxID=2981790 RepID=A0ABT2T7F8_9FIRM|nr:MULTISPECIES: hypothetical protein [Lachnospiraceae]MCU6746198.1 hypothetical protein [Faecalicatena acetigenes]SCH00876.1 Uncharacterised protein [uncultured Clostridium sp.]